MFDRSSLVIRAAFTFLLASGLLIWAAPVAAQQADENEALADIDEIVVIEGSTDTQPGIRPATGYKTDSALLSRHVSFADLDLSEPADVALLEQRIEIAAEETCEALEKTFPLGQKTMADVQRCIKKAIEGTTEAFETAVAAAN